MALCAQLSTEIKYIRQYINAKSRFNCETVMCGFVVEEMVLQLSFPRVFRFSQTNRHPSVTPYWFTIDPLASVPQ
jgi:hypothetical protein